MLLLVFWIFRKKNKVEAGLFFRQMAFPTFRNAEVSTNDLRVRKIDCCVTKAYPLIAKSHRVRSLPEPVEALSQESKVEFVFSSLPL